MVVMKCYDAPTYVGFVLKPYPSISCPRPSVSKPRKNYNNISNNSGCNSHNNKPGSYCPATRFKMLQMNKKRKCLRSNFQLVGLLSHGHSYKF